MNGGALITYIIEVDGFANGGSASGLQWQVYVSINSDLNEANTYYIANIGILDIRAPLPHPVHRA
jgi:hypothetical protein